MEENINFTNITKTTINSSNINQNNIQSNNGNYTNENIILFDDNDFEMNAILDPKKYHKKEFDIIMLQMKEKFNSLMQKSKQIINSQSFSFKNFLTNNLNIQVLAKEEKNIINKSNIPSINNSFNNKSFNSNESSINGNGNGVGSGSNLFIKKTISKNHFKVYDINNNSNSSLNIYNQNSGEINSPKLIGKKRKSEKNGKNEKKEQEIKALFKEILDICNEISNFNNDIIKKEDQNSINTDSDNIETTLKINNDPIATIFVNGEIINKVYVFKTQKYFVKENEIISQLKHIKKNISSILNKLKKNKNH